MQKTGFCKNLIALLVGCLLVVIIDLTLGLFGVEPLATQEASLGFEAGSPLFVATRQANDSRVYQRNPKRERYFNTQSFEDPKPEQTMRVVTFGGSTTYGRPYLNDTSFTNWFKELLLRYGTNPRIETINTGGISYASYRIYSIMQEMVNYQPDLFIVYAGHNEFLEARTFAEQKNETQTVKSLRHVLHRSRLYTLLKRSIDGMREEAEPESMVLPGDEVVARLEQVGGPELYQRDTSFRQNVIKQYRESLEAMVDLAQSQQIPILLCTLPSNLSGVSPFKSEHRAGLNPADWARWQQSFEKGLGALKDGNWTLAYQAFSRAEQIDDQYAALHYYIAQALEQLGKWQDSYTAYVRAKQEDIVPLRALEEMNQIVREIAKKKTVPLADVEAFMCRVSRGGIPGNNLFVDHVHPTIEGQQLVAWVVLNAAVDAGLVPLDKEQWSNRQEEAREYLRKREASIPQRYRAMGVWGVGRLYYWAGKSPEAYVALKEAWQTVKDIPEIPRKLGLLELERGDVKAALDYFEVAEKMEPDHPWLLLGLARAQTANGEPRQALATLERLPAARVNDPGFHAAQGQALLQLGRFDQALQALQSAWRLAPELPSSEQDLAVALAVAGKRDEAAKHYRRYLELSGLPQSEQLVDEWLRLQQSCAASGGQP